MVTARYLQTITSKQAFNRRYNAEKAQPFIELQHTSASSKWGLKELFACRVLPSVRETLPLLRDSVASDQSVDPEIRRFIEGPESSDHLGWSELALVRHYGHSLGQIWAALATFQGPPDRRPGTGSALDASGQGEGQGEDHGDDDRESSGRGKRVRRNTQQEGFCDSSTMQVGSSSPVSASNRGSSLGYVDADSQAPWQPEDDTLHFIRCALRHVLYFAPPHASPDVHAVVEVRDAKVRLSAVAVDENRPLVAVDDGGLCSRRRERGNVFRTIENRMVMLEAKGQLQCIEDGRPFVSDDCLAQMTCQALTARLADPQNELEHGSVIILHAAQHYACFLQFDLSDDYLQDLESVTPTTFLDVHCGPWYDLGSRDGRINFAHVVCAITRRAKA